MPRSLVAQNHLLPTRCIADASNRQALPATLPAAERGPVPGEGSQEAALITLGTAGRIITWSAAATRLFGYQEHEIRNAHFVKLLAPEALFSNVPERLLAIAAQLQPVSEEHWCARSDGSRFWAELSLSAMVDRNGTLQGFSLITSNQSAHKQTQLLQQFLLDISPLFHEIHSPKLLYTLLTNLPVPLLADYCTLHLWDEEHQLEVVATSELEDDQEAAIWQDLWSMQSALNYVRHLERALHTGHAELASLGADTPDAAGLPLKARARPTGPRRPRQLMIVPLLVRGATLGALTLIALRPDQTYGPRDLAHASQFVQLGAQALERMLAAQRLPSSEHSGL